MDRGYHGKGFCAAADMGSSGLSALIRTGAELSLEFEMEPLSCGSVGDADYALEIAGRHLVFRIALQGAENRLAAALMDGDGTYEMLLRARDDAAGWQTVHKLIAALEKHGIRSLRRRSRRGTAATANKKTSEHKP